MSPKISYRQNGNASFDEAKTRTPAPTSTPDDKQFQLKPRLPRTSISKIPRHVQGTEPSDGALNTTPHHQTDEPLVTSSNVAQKKYLTFSKDQATSHFKALRDELASGQGLLTVDVDAPQSNSDERCWTSVARKPGYHDEVGLFDNLETDSSGLSKAHQKSTKLNQSNTSLMVKPKPLERLSKQQVISDHVMLDGDKCSSIEAISHEDCPLGSDSLASRSTSANDGSIRHQPICEAFIMTGQSMLKLSCNETESGKSHLPNNNNNNNNNNSTTAIGSCRNTSGSSTNSSNITSSTSSRPTAPKLEADVEGVSSHSETVARTDAPAGRESVASPLFRVSVGAATSTNSLPSRAETEASCPQSGPAEASAGAGAGEGEALRGRSPLRHVPLHEQAGKQNNRKSSPESAKFIDTNPSRKRAGSTDKTGERIGMLSSKENAQKAATKSSPTSKSTDKGLEKRDLGKAATSEKDFSIEFKTGHLIRKRTFDAHGVPTGKGRRGWRRVFVILKDLRLIVRFNNGSGQQRQQEDECESNKILAAKQQELATRTSKQISAQDLKNTVKLHHSFAKRSESYQKREHVFQVRFADQSEFLLQAANEAEMNSWIDTINFASACLSSPALARAVSNGKRYVQRHQRPILPASYTKLSYWEQLIDHEERLQRLKQELEDHLDEAQAARNADKQSKSEFIERIANLRQEIERYAIYLELMRKKSNSPEAIILSKHPQFASLAPSSQLADQSESNCGKKVGQL